MTFQKGNQWWKQRAKHGRDRLFASPELLLESAMEYFDWCDKNPWHVTKITESEKGTFTETKPIQRPYSRLGFYIYIGASTGWMHEFKKTCSADFLDVINQIEEIIDKQQIEGASVGVFKENIIARLVGLKETTKVEVDQPKPIQIEIIKPGE